MAPLFPPTLLSVSGGGRPKWLFQRPQGPGGVLERDTLWRGALGIVLRLGGDAGWVWAKGTLFLFAIVF